MEDKKKIEFNDHVDDYRTRRINLTFRYVPVEDILDYQDFPAERIRDTKKYVEQLATYSDFWKKVSQGLSPK